MRDLSIDAFLAIIQQMLGAAFWPAAIAAALIVLLFLLALVRGSGRRGMAAMFGLAAGLLAASAAAGLAPMATQANFADLNGPVDWGLLALIGAGAFAVLFPTVFILAVFASSDPGSA